MIIFTWSLTTNQIACLRTIAHNQALEESGDFSGDLSGGNSYFISGLTRLFKEGYILKREVPVKGHERPRWTGKTRPKWEVTDKGRLILQLVAIELVQSRQDMAIMSNELKKLKAG